MPVPPSFQPNVAFWNFGASNGGPDDPGTHTNGSSSNRVTEFDCEMGSDPAGKSPVPDDKHMLMRNGTYIGHQSGGSSEIWNPDNMPLMPNFWVAGQDGVHPDKYSISMQGTHTLKTNPLTGEEEPFLSLTRVVTDVTTGVVTTIGPQDIGFGPFAPGRLEFAIQMAPWNSKRQTPAGNASITLNSLSVKQSSPFRGNVKYRIPPDKVDYGSYLPGSGGLMPFTPFAPRSDADIIAGFQTQLTDWQKTPSGSPPTPTAAQKAFADNFKMPSPATIASLQAIFTQLGEGIYAANPGMQWEDVQALYSDLSLGTAPQNPADIKNFTDLLAAWKTGTAAEQNFANTFPVTQPPTLDQIGKDINALGVDIFTKYPNLTQADVCAIYAKLDLGPPPIDPAGEPPPTDPLQPLKDLLDQWKQSGNTAEMNFASKFSIVSEETLKQVQDIFKGWGVDIYAK